ncbi:thiamine pyridinylase [Bradyrhizobium sp. BRP22]|uniref:thiamine pyridinylase n=1 Tax=Bradyrhizobium sp. BRP22 TaxID=2793821 RepID=UPI001CD64B39|nr:thiamine pyridinylase [Bradyrhizobium sp. BRP22]MCA1458921.1 thiamine pyridinylase [Bradyrhizobium sp. BRP22]
MQAGNCQQRRTDMRRCFRHSSAIRAGLVALAAQALSKFRRTGYAVVASAILPVVALPSSAAEAQQSLTVALYPYVPRIGQFQNAITTAWSQVQPNVRLKFINDESVWDGGYKRNPPAEADVYVFDAMYFEQFRANNYLVAMARNEIQDAADFLPYARKAVVANGKYYAIPQLGCANILFYDKNDTVVVNATTLGQLQTALNQCTFTSEIPPDRRGLMLDMAGGTTNATLYLDIAHSADGIYPLPQASQPNRDYLVNQKTMLNMSSFWNITAQNSDPYVRGVWFSQGYGRAFMGFTETMSRMTPDALATIGFKVMPLSNTTTNRPLFYVDAVGVNTTTVERGTRDLAVQLANVLTATDTVVASFEAPGPNTNPQYLMSVRHSVFHQLGQRYPLYERMYHLALSSNPVAFKLNADARAWVNSIAGTIRTEVRANYACGCDQNAPRPIMNSVDAQNVCPAVCNGHGGWSGQWTNQPPALRSACGCAACPVQGPQ